MLEESVILKERYHKNEIAVSFFTVLYSMSWRGLSKQISD